jgi:hypothetical protein
MLGNSLSNPVRPPLLAQEEAPKEQPEAANSPHVQAWGLLVASL